MNHSSQAGIRLLPHSVEAEQSVLGSIIHYPPRLGVVKGWLTPESFFSPAHRDIFAAILVLDQKEEDIDEVTIINQLQFVGKLDPSGGAVYIAELVDLTPPGLNLKSYAGIEDQRDTQQEILQEIRNGKH